jgi:hypothetical protein
MSEDNEVDEVRREVDELHDVLAEERRALEELRRRARALPREKKQRKPVNTVPAVVIDAAGTRHIINVRRDRLLSDG